MTRADNSLLLVEAAHRRSVEARRRALDAVTALADAGLPVNPTTVARHARVSRQWLYTFDGARQAIAAVAPQVHSQPDAPPRAQRPTTASLQRRLEAVTDDNHRLRQRVRELEDRLAGLYGQWRLHCDGDRAG